MGDPILASRWTSISASVAAAVVVASFFSAPAAGHNSTNPTDPIDCGTTAELLLGVPTVDSVGTGDASDSFRYETQSQTTMVIIEITTGNVELHVFAINPETSACECIFVCHHHFVGGEGDSFTVPETSYYSLPIEVVKYPLGGLNTNAYALWAVPSA